MSAHIGIVACSAEGAALCYRTICAEAVADEADLCGYRKPAILGTKYLMTGPVYPNMFARYGLEWAIPDEATRERIDTIIFSELVIGIIREESRQYLNAVIAGLKERGCDAVVLGCTEIPLIVDPNDCPLPTLDSTRLLARAALRATISDS